MVFILIHNETIPLELTSNESIPAMNGSYGMVENVTYGNISVDRGATAADSLRWGVMAMSFIILCTTLGNLLVCLAVIWDRRLQNMTNYFLMSLAIADLLVSILVMPFGVMVEIFGFFPLHAEFCVFWVTMDVLMCTASIWHMCTMSMDRFFTLKYPMRYGRNKTKMTVALKIFFAWAVSITISSPICISGIKNTASVYNDGACVPTITDFVIYGSVFAFYIPLTIMLITYVLTIRILWKNQSMMRNIERSDFRTTKYNAACGIRTLLSPPSNEGSGKASFGNSETDATLASNHMLSNTKHNVSLDTIQDSGRQLLSQQNTLPCQFSPVPSEAISLNGTDQHQTTPKALIEMGNNFIQNHDDHAEIPKQILANERNPNETFNEIDTPFRITVLGSSNASINSGSRLNSRSLDIKTSSMACLKSSSEFEKELNSEQPKMDYLSPRMDNLLRVSSNDCILRPSEKPSLHAAASFSTVPQTKQTAQRTTLTHFHSCSDIHGKDFKFIEWKQHYYQIQKEMDQILKDSEIEQKIKRLASESVSRERSYPNRRRSQSSSCYLSIESPHSPANSETGDSMDDLDDSSSNDSDLITIKLRPTSLNMYKVSISAEQTSPLLASSKTNGHCPRYGNIDRTDLGHQNQSNLIRSQQSSSNIRHLLKRFNKTQGMNQFMSKRATSNEKKASKVLGIIFAVFVILWTPFFTVNIMSVTCSNCMSNVTPEMMSVFLWMGYVASLANPIIYTMFNTAFRRAFIKILKCHLCIKGTLRDSTNIMSYAVSTNGCHYGSNHPLNKGDNRRNTMVQLFRES